MPSGDCLWLVRPDLGVHQEHSCLHVVASSMRDGWADYTTPDAGEGRVAERCLVLRPLSSLKLPPLISRAPS